MANAAIACPPLRSGRYVGLRPEPLRVSALRASSAHASRPCAPRLPPVPSLADPVEAGAGSWAVARVRRYALGLRVTTAHRVEGVRTCGWRPCEATIQEGPSSGWINVAECVDEVWVTAMRLPGLDQDLGA